ncbi:hypothetical protein HK101_006318 [Irineochytrium annulatum]|nr:hypothetical protein HK101_006318 [Irineochytrium annulatum]
MATEPLPRTSYSHANLANGGNSGSNGNPNHSGNNNQHNGMGGRSASDNNLNSPNNPTSSPHPPAIAPFSAGRFDSSASVAGGPQDPRIIRQGMEPSKLAMRGYQTFVQALGSYRRQIQAMGAASEAFVRALEDLAEFVPGAEIRKPHIIGDLDFLIDSTHLISNANQIWDLNICAYQADSLERDFEEPLVRHMNDMMIKAKVTQKENKQKIDELVERLHREEEASYKMGKKKQRDLMTLQNSLNARVALADEIKRLTVESATIQDTLASKSVETILSNCAAGVRAELENYDRVMEGLKKLGAFANEPSNSDQPYQSSRQTRYSMYSSTEILPNDSISNVMPNMGGGAPPPLPPGRTLPMTPGGGRAGPSGGGAAGRTAMANNSNNNNNDGDFGFGGLAGDDEGGFDIQIMRSALNSLG